MIYLNMAHGMSLRARRRTWLGVAQDQLAWRWRAAADCVLDLDQRKGSEMLVLVKKSCAKSRHRREHSNRKHNISLVEQGAASIGMGVSGAKAMSW